MLSQQPDFQFEVIINLFIASGIRAGELSALYWEDINLETGMMFIRHTLVKVGGEYVRQEPKTIDSTRRIILPEYITGLLKKHKALQTEQRFKLGTAWKDKNLVFTNLSGGFYLGTNINNKLKRIIAGTDLPQDLHLHSMRHTHASLLINSDVAARVIADRLGHSTDPYYKVIWRCNRKYSRKDTKCPNRHLNEEKIKELFVIAVNQLVIQRDEILATYYEILSGLTDTAALDADLQRLELEKDGALQRITDLIHENATTKMDQGEYNRRYDALEAQRVAISEKQKRIKEKLSDKLFRKRKLEAFMSELKSAEQRVSFDEQLFVRTVEQITVFPGKLVFVFKDGTEIPVEE